jgi:NitT/TauT family transport system ATP-binding protein
MNPKLAARDIRLEYLQPRSNARLTVLDGVNLEIAEGEFVSIVGPSGCGKTTFLSIVDGLLPATAGCVLVDGKPTAKPGPDRAVVFQDASHVCYGLECLGMRKRDARKKAARFIDMVGLSGFEQHTPMNCPAEWSSG